MTACSHIPRRARERSGTIRLGRPGLSSAGPCRAVMAVGSSVSYCRASPSQPGDCIMPRLHFGAFLAPHHPIGEHPMLQFRRDLEFVEHLDKHGYDEFWCGEHHSSGWEMIASPEMFLAAAGERSTRIKLATGVISLPYHHPFHVAQRMVQLDHMTGGRAIFGSGPGALASDAHTLGVDPMLLRDRQDEAIGIIRRLFNGERVTATSDWFTLQDAALQLLPLQEDLPCAVASQISPSGMTLAGKHGIGVISIGSLSEEGLNALPTQWRFAEAAAAQHGQTVDRTHWRVLLSWHIAETRDKAPWRAAGESGGPPARRHPAPCPLVARPLATAAREAALLASGATRSRPPGALGRLVQAAPAPSGPTDDPDVYARGVWSNHRQPGSSALWPAALAEPSPAPCRRDGAEASGVCGAPDPAG